MVAASAIVAGGMTILGGGMQMLAGRDQAHQTRELTAERVNAIREDRVNLAVSSQIQRDLISDRFKRAASNLRAAAGASGVSQQSESLVQALEQQAIEAAREDAMLILEQQQQDETMRRQEKIVREEGHSAERAQRAQGAGSILGGFGQLLGGLF